jgi:hypothetical protein
MPKWRAQDIETLFEALESDDSFRRLDAIERLEALTRMTLGYRFNDPETARLDAVSRWKHWWKEQLEEEIEQKQIQAAIQVTGGAVDLKALKQAIKEIPAEKIQGYLNALVHQMKAQKRRCEACGVRPATVSVTEVVSGEMSSKSLCDPCAQERGDVWI